MPQFFICLCHFKLRRFDDLHSRDRLDGNGRTCYTVIAWNNSCGSFWNLSLFYGVDPKTTCTCWSLAVTLPTTFPSVDGDSARGRKQEKQAPLIYACAYLFIIVAIASSMQCICRLSPPTFFIVQSFSVYSHIARPMENGMDNQPAFSRGKRAGSL